MILDRRRIAAFVEAAFCIFALSMFLGAYTGIPLRLEGISVKGGASNPYNAAAMALVLVGLAAYVSVRWSRFVFVLRHGGAVNLFVAMAAVSVLWAVDPWITARKTMTLVQTLAFAYYLAASHPVERIIRYTAAAIGISLVASAAVAIAAPSVGVMSDPGLAGTWQGVYPHKSGLGGVASSSVLFFGWLMWTEPRRRWLHGLMAAFSVAMVLMAQSKTGQVTIALTLGIAVFLPLLRLPGLGKVWAAYLMAVVGLALGTILYLYFGRIMEALGKDASLTGRVPTWLGLLDLAWQRPLGGYGYMGFFVGSNPELEDIWRRSGWTMWDAHSTLIEMLLHLGIPGVVVTAWALAEMVVRSLRAWAEGSMRWASFAVVYAATYVVTCTVETVVYRAGDIQTVLFPLIYVLLRIADARRTAGARRAAPMTGRPLDAQYGLAHWGADPAARP